MRSELSALSISTDSWSRGPWRGILVVSEDGVSVGFVGGRMEGGREGYVRGGGRRNCY